MRVGTNPTEVAELVKDAHRLAGGSEGVAARGIDAAAPDQPVPRFTPRFCPAGRAS